MSRPVATGVFEASEVDIIAYGQAFDPFDFHTDPIGARNSFFGALCASGLQSATLALEAAAVGLGVGADRRLARIARMNHVTPLFAGERVTVEVVPASPEADHPAWLVHGRNPSGAIVVEVEMQLAAHGDPPSRSPGAMPSSGGDGRSNQSRLFFEDCEPGARFGGASLIVSTELDDLFTRLVKPSVPLAPAGAVHPMLTFGLTQRLAHGVFWSRAEIAAGAGGIDLTWHAPVRHGDCLVLHFEVIEARPLKSRPNMGLIRGGYTLWHADTGVPAFSFDGVAFLRRRGGKDQALS